MGIKGALYGTETEESRGLLTQMNDRLHRGRYSQGKQWELSTDCPLTLDLPRGATQKKKKLLKWKTFMVKYIHDVLQVELNIFTSRFSQLQQQQIALMPAVVTCQK